MRTIRSFLIALPLLLVAGCASQSDVTVIKLGHSLSTEHSVHQAMEFMAERLAEKSGGTMRMDIYASGQLGSERVLLELLQIGSVDVTKVSAAVLEGFAPSYQMFSVPYLFRDPAHHYAVVDGDVGKDILLDGEEYWLRGLVYYDAGSRSFYTKTRPILTPADLTGFKIRTQPSPSASQLLTALGGSATPIDWGELYSALQQGVVDGAENNAPSYYLSRHYEVAPHYALDEHTTIPDVLLVSTKTWGRLTPQQQQWLQEAAEESVPYQRELWQAADAEALRAVQEAGVQVYRPDKAPFVEKVQPLYERLPPDIRSLVERARAVQVPGAAPEPLEATDALAEG